MGFQDIFQWWTRAGFQRQVRKALQSTVSTPSHPRAFLDGSGVVIVPSDPVEAALSASAIGDFCGMLRCPVRLAGPPGSLRWIPVSSGTPIEIAPGLGKRSFGQWLEYHRADRADWCLLAASHPTALEEACLSWLGTGARFAPLGACRSKTAVNVQIQSDSGTSLDERMRRFLRVLQPDLPPLPDPAPARTQGPILLEIPPDLPEKGGRSTIWLRQITTLATRRSLLLAHSEALPAVIRDQVRSLGPRVALVHLSSAHEVRELARRARCWIATRSPASALASLEGCRIHLVGRSTAAKDFPHPELLTVSGKIDELDTLDVE